MIKLNLSLKFSFGLKKSEMRNSLGVRTFYHKGGGYKKRLKFVDYYYKFTNIPAIIKKIELDNSRTAAIALISYLNEVLSFIIASEGLFVGQLIYISNNNIKQFYGLKKNDICELSSIKNFKPISVVTSNMNKGAQLGRAYGSFLQILRLTRNFSLVKLPSSESKFCPSSQKVILGIPVKMFNKNNNFLFKAGKNRNLGYKSIVRKCAMNPVDHPHGGNTSSKAIGLTYKGITYKHKKNKKVTFIIS